MKGMLKNKKVLFFSPTFFGYETKMKEAMEELGAEVDFFDERSITKNYEKALLKVFPKVFKKKSENYYMEIFKTICDKQYDYVFFVKCEMATDKILTLYKNTFENAKFCLYLYDSIYNVSGIEKKFQYFDVVSTFDRKDSVEKKLNFRPLFYTREYIQMEQSEEYIFDLCFIGTIHSDRYRILKEIKKQADLKGLKTYFYPYLQSVWMYYFYKLFKREFRNTKISDFKFNKISGNDIADIVSKSRLVVDVQHPKQTGLTMRTIEMIGMNKKLMTTNEDIVNYDFYDNNNIHVVKRDSIEIDENRILRPYNKLDDKIYDSYFINNWIIEVLGAENEK